MSKLDLATDRRGVAVGTTTSPPEKLDGTIILVALGILLFFPTGICSLRW